MKKTGTKKLILSLIKDDLIHFKLVNSLNKMGLNADHYFLNINDAIFKLMGFADNKKTELIFERYLELSKGVMFMDISRCHNHLDNLALQIYRELRAGKN